jgi:hypothetical protein
VHPPVHDAPDGRRTAFPSFRFHLDQKRISLAVARTARRPSRGTSAIFYRSSPSASVFTSGSRHPLVRAVPPPPITPARSRSGCTDDERARRPGAPVARHHRGRRSSPVERVLRQPEILENRRCAPAATGALDGASSVAGRRVPAPCTSARASPADLERAPVLLRPLVGLRKTVPSLPPREASRSAQRFAARRARKYVRVRKPHTPARPSAHRGSPEPSTTRPADLASGGPPRRSRNLGVARRQTHSSRLSGLRLHGGGGSPPSRRSRASGAGVFTTFEARNQAARVGERRLPSRRRRAAAGTRPLGVVDDESHSRRPVPP